MIHLLNLLSVNVLTHHLKTRHENLHGKFSICAEYPIRCIGQKLTFMLKVFPDYLEEHIRGKQSHLTVCHFAYKRKV